MDSKFVTKVSIFHNILLHYLDMLTLVKTRENQRENIFYHLLDFRNENRTYIINACIINQKTHMYYLT